MHIATGKKLCACLFDLGDDQRAFLKARTAQCQIAIGWVHANAQFTIHLGTGQCHQCRCPIVLRRHFNHRHIRGSGSVCGKHHVGATVSNCYTLVGFAVRDETIKNNICSFTDQVECATGCVKA
jgi:hypothetical protein